VAEVLEISWNLLIFLLPENEWKSKSTGKTVEMHYEKMSKSKANGVDPLEIIDKFGVDLTRLQLLGVSAPRADLNWGETGKFFSVRH
jgi:leucyl-tRNA synthetase